MSMKAVQLLRKLVGDVRVGLRPKILFSIAVVIIITSLSLTWFFVKSQVVQLRISLENRCVTLARNLALNTEYGVLTKNKDFILKLAEGLVEEDDVLYALVYDKDGSLLVSKGMFMKQGREIKMDPFLQTINLKRPGIKPGVPLSQTYTTSGGEAVHDVLVPITVKHLGSGREELGFIDDMPSGANEEIIGFARVGISLYRLNQQISAVKKGVVGLTVFVVLIGILLSFFLVRLIVQPIKQLAVGTQKIASGNLDYRVAVFANDEIGDLAASFNRMADDLNRHEIELQKERDDLLVLKKALEQRTAELEDTLMKMQNIQQELIRSEKFATIGRLASSVAHDLRNPLASLKNISYYLMKVGAFTDERAKKMLDMLSADVARANKIVTDLLDFSRIKKLNKTVMPIDQFLNSLIDNFVFSEQILVTRDFESFELSFDPDRLTQVMVNLLSNASDAMAGRPDGKIMVQVRRLERFCEITMVDTGCGMDKETVEHMFDPLFTTKLKGLGLGMAIVKDIIDAHCGRITVASEPGKGSTIKIALPL